MKVMDIILKVKFYSKGQIEMKIKYILISLVAIISSFIIYFVVFDGGSSLREASEKVYNRNVNSGYNIASALTTYFRACGRYPTTDQGLKLLRKNDSSCNYVAAEKIIKNDFINGAKNPFIYISDGKSFKLLSIPHEYYLWSSDGKLFETIGGN